MVDSINAGPVCPGCKTPIVSIGFNVDEGTLCSTCGSHLFAAVFPALYRPIEKGATAAWILTDDQASCFYHEGKKAVTACDACGRFLCAVCDIHLDRHLCPGCFEMTNKKGQLPQVRKTHVRQDEVALALAVIPLLMAPITAVTAPLTIAHVIRHWKAPGGIVPRTKIRFVVAMILALTEIAVWILLVAALVRGY